MEKGRFITGLALALAVWAIVASSIAAYYYNEYVRISEALRNIEEATVRVSVVIDYGNGTVERFDNVVLDAHGATALNALLMVAKVQYTVYPFGVFVDSINGVANSKELNSWWLYSILRPNGEEFAPQVGADQYRLSNGETVVWRYTKFS